MKLVRNLAGVLLLLTGIAQSATVSFTANLLGTNEDPPNASPGTGSALVTFDTVAHTMEVNVTFADLVAGNTAAHIHCCTAVPGVSTAGVVTPTPTFTGFPGGVTSGSYSHVFDMTLTSSYRAGYLTGFLGDTAAAEAALLQGAKEGKAYLNIHSSVFSAGEIRGFLVETPEPGTFVLAGAALGLTAIIRRRVA